MTAASFLLLGAAAAALAGVITWELGGASDTLLPARPAIPKASSATVAAAPDQPAGLVAAVLARPLFSPDRRLPAPGVVAKAEPDATLPRLTGVLVTSAGRRAMFAGAPRPTIVQEGGRLGSFTVQFIKPGEVVLLGPDGTHALRPSFDPARPAPSSAPAAVFPGQPLLLQPTPVASNAVQGVPNPFFAVPNAPRDAVPFAHDPAPSGLAILRNEASRTAAGAPPAR